MPTYDYKCDACSHTFEKWQSFKEDVLKDCPECKTDNLRRLFGMPFIYTKREPTTLIQQAEKNSKKFGREECEERELKAEEKVNEYKKSKGITPKNDVQTPWWRNGVIPDLVESSTPIKQEQAEKYTNELQSMGCNVQPNAERKKE